MKVTASLIRRNSLPSPNSIVVNLQQARSLPKSHRIADVGRDLWRSATPALPLKLGQLEQTAQKPLQSGFEYLQGWSFHRLSGKPVWVFGCPHSEKNHCLHLNGISHVFSLCPLPLVPFTGHHWLGLLYSFPSGICTH